jgi:hypothetical protein
MINPSLLQVMGGMLYFRGSSFWFAQSCIFKDKFMFKL